MTKILPITPEEIIAAKIVDYLFTNGRGDKADRLRLVLPDGRDGGGWSREAIERVICLMIKEQQAPHAGKEASDDNPGHYQE